MKKLAQQIFEYISQMENPQEFIEKIETIFIENRLPYTGKLLRIFEQLYPREKITKMIDPQRASPYLVRLNNLKNNTEFLYMNFFTDLLKVHIESGNLSIKNFLKNFIAGKNLAKKYENSETLNVEELQILGENSITLIHLFQHKNTHFSDEIEVSDDFLKNFEMLKKCINSEKISDIFVYFEKYFLSSLGYENAEDALYFMDENIIKTNTHNANFAEKNNFEINSGDLIK